jgi:hypothetical protein
VSWQLINYRIKRLWELPLRWRTDSHCGEKAAEGNTGVTDGETTFIGSGLSRASPQSIRQQG